MIGAAGMADDASPLVIATRHNPAAVARLRDLVDRLHLGNVDPKTARLAANELATLADAIEAGGATCAGYAAVPLIGDDDVAAFGHGLGRAR